MKLIRHSCKHLIPRNADPKLRKPTHDPIEILESREHPTNPMKSGSKITQQPDSRLDRARLQMRKEDMAVFIDAIKAISP